MGNASVGPTSMCTGVGNCGDWRTRASSSDGLAFTIPGLGKNAPPRYEYPAIGQTPRSPLDGQFGDITPRGGSSPAQELVRKFVKDMLKGMSVVIPPAWPSDMRGHDSIVSFDKRLKVLCLRSAEARAEVSTQACVPLTCVSSIAFGSCNPGEGRLPATERSVTLFLDEGYGPALVMEFGDVEERDTFAICLSMFVDGRRVEADKRSL
eukprot:TRINITY_DN111359_c0_g1_i1.p1 TRINITY_DN111359_c0_g1~~TRINITY_DN111359_c0_g1_i1.p1  ORF type:complete len:208 (+),score=32.87 TRINITY_DN111359_c0_g1_i1:43-666(+)